MFDRALNTPLVSRNCVVMTIISQDQIKEIAKLIVSVILIIFKNTVRESKGKVFINILGKNQDFF